MRPLPFPIKAWFDTFVILIYSIDKEKAASLLPYPLQFDTYKQHALMAAAFVKTKNFRPAILPSWIGMNFNLAGYRLLSTYQKQDDTIIRGLKIIQSQTNRQIMKLMGNKITQYRFDYNPINILTNGDQVSIHGKGIDVALRFHQQPPLPESSVFESWNHARKYAGPLLYTFDILDSKKEVSITQGTRKNWQPKPIEVLHSNLDFFEQEHIKILEPKLCAAYALKDIPYDWKKAVQDSFAYRAY